MSIGDYIIVLLMFATFGVLVVGIALMGAGGEANKRYSNRLMMARVSLQGMVLIMLAVMFLK